MIACIKICTKVVVEDAAEDKVEAEVVLEVDKQDESGQPKHQEEVTAIRMETAHTTGQIIIRLNQRIKMRQLLQT